jgi:hypothetical protein
VACPNYKIPPTTYCTLKKIVNIIFKSRSILNFRLVCKDQDFIITVFCVIDDELEKMLQGRKLRERGGHPTLVDSEVIKMEIVGEFLGKDCDKIIYEYFKSHWKHLFPRIPDRSNFVRQAANLHVVKRMLRERLSFDLGSLADSLHIKDIDEPPFRLRSENAIESINQERKAKIC